MIAWVVGRALDQVWNDDQARASDTLALLMCALEQAAMDKGNWDLA